MRVFVTRRLPGDALDRLAAEHEVEVWPDRLPPPREEMLARASEVEGLLALLTDKVDAQLIDAAPRLRAISNYAVGRRQRRRRGGQRARHPGRQHARAS